MSSSLSRRFKRKASRKMSYEEIKERMEKSTDTTVGLFMAIPVDVLFEDYGWTPEQLSEFADKMTSRYDDITDHYKYAQGVYEKTGVAVVRTEVINETL